MSPAEQIEELREEIAYLKSELGFSIDHDKLSRLKVASGLTKSEAGMLLALAQTSRVMTREHLHECVTLWDGESPKIVDVYVSRIRKKLPDAIDTVWGLGYGISAHGKAYVERFA